MSPEEQMQKQVQDAVELIIGAYQTGWASPAGRPPFDAKNLPNKRKIGKALKAIVINFVVSGKNAKGKEQVANIHGFISAITASLMSTSNGKYVHAMHVSKIAMLLSKKFQKIHKRYKQACTEGVKADNTAEEKVKKDDKKDGEVIEAEILEFYRDGLKLKINDLDTLVTQFGLSINNADAPSLHEVVFEPHLSSKPLRSIALRAEKTFLNAKIKAFDKARSEIMCQLELLQGKIAYEKIPLLSQEERHSGTEAKRLSHLEATKSELEDRLSAWEKEHGLQLKALMEIMEIIYDELKEKDTDKLEELLTIKCTVYEEAQKMNSIGFNIRQEIRSITRKALQETSPTKLALLKEIKRIAAQELQETSSEKLALLKEIKDLAYKELDEEKNNDKCKLFREIKNIAYQELEEQDTIKLKILREIKSTAYQELKNENLQKEKDALYQELQFANNNFVLHFCTLLLLTGVALGAILLIEELFEEVAQENTPDHSPIELLSCTSSTEQMMSFSEHPAACSPLPLGEGRVRGICLI